MQYRVISAEKRTGGGDAPPYPITGCPHRKLCGRLFFVPGRRRAAGGCLRGGLSAGRSVCGVVCLWGGQFAASESFQGRGQGRNWGTGQENRESGNRGIGGGSPVGQWSVVGSVGGRFAGRMFPGRGEWPFLRSPKYLRRISCTVRNNPVYLQVRTEEANR